MTDLDKLREMAKEIRRRWHYTGNGGEAIGTVFAFVDAQAARIEELEKAAHEEFVSLNLICDRLGIAPGEIDSPYDVAKAVIGRIKELEDELFQAHEGCGPRCPGFSDCPHGDTTRKCWAWTGNPWCHEDEKGPRILLGNSCPICRARLEKS